MTKSLSLFFLLFFVTCCLAQTKPTLGATQKPNQNHPAHTEAAEPSLPSRKHAGPNGLGPIKIGLTKDALEQLGEKDGAYLSEPMTPYDDKYSKPVEGVEKYETTIRVSFLNKAALSVLTFHQNVLVRIYLKFNKDDYLYESLKDQITEKFGSGKSEDNKRERQCTYRNGANFKLQIGSRTTTWTNNISSDELIKTEMLDWTGGGCPLDLRFAIDEQPSLKTMTIEKIQNTEEYKKSNSLF